MNEPAERAMCDVCDKHPWVYNVVACGLETHVCEKCYGSETLSTADSASEGRT